MKLLVMPIALKVVLIGVALAAACYDLRVRRIPNWINLSGAALGIGLNTYFEGSAGAVTAGGGLLVALCIYLPLYLLKGMGAGDVKLMAAIGAIAGPENWFNIFIATALLGGIASLVLVVLRKRTGRTVLNLSIIVGQLARGKAPCDSDGALSIRSEKSLKMPHGAIIAAGVGLFLVLHWNA
jgi:prepilin peptidase CpaA